ncbi:MAG: biotin transporter BioY [Acidobacteria bacterium]|nr:biotin transporter BioY [Acidobacteriota bacterium]
MAIRAPYITYDSTLLDHVGLGAASSAARTSIRIASMLFVTVLTAVAAQVSVHLPFTPVPLTLQPMVALVGAAALGARLGASSQVLYLLLGIAGLPVFAASPILPQGLGRLLGPTGGYLMAYPIAAFVTGYLAARGFDRRYFTSILAMFAGVCTLFVGGVSWLAYFAPAPGGPVGLNVALATGLYPFIVKDFIKVAIASGVLPAAWKIVGTSKDS